jgi:hypothetical protein
MFTTMLDFIFDKGVFSGRQLILPSFAKFVYN